MWPVFTQKICDVAHGSKKLPIPALDHSSSPKKNHLFFCLNVIHKNFIGQVKKGQINLKFDFNYSPKYMLANKNEQKIFSCLKQKDIPIFCPKNQFIWQYPIESKRV
jgi:hypothetical protein